MSTAVRVVAFLGVLAPVTVLGVVLARWSHPAANRVDRLVAGLVWATSGLVLAGFAAGAVGRFTLGWLTTVLVVAALAAVGVVARSDRPVAAPPTTGARDRSSDRTWRVVAGALVALMVTQWANSAALALRTGMTDPDSQHYHLTHAARFVQTGEVFAVHRVSAGDLAAFHPNTDELVRAVGMLATRAEASGLVWVVVTAVLAVAAAVAVGLRRGRGAGVVAVTAAVMILPGGARLYAGSAANDWAAIALLLAAVALWDAARDTRMLVPAGLAAGLAVGTKLSVLAAVGAFGIAAVVLPHVVPRARRAAVLIAAAAATGAWWFVRNWVVAGTPVPGAGLPGLEGPAAPLLDDGAFSVLHYATDLGVVRDWFLPGIAWSLGPLWWVVLAVVVAGIVLGFLGARGRVDGGGVLVRLLAVVAAVSLLAYLVTPTGAAGAPGEPVLFQYNVRYLLPAIVCAAWVVALRAPDRFVVPGAGILVLVTLVPSASWASRSPVWAVVGLGAVVVGAGLALRGRVPTVPVAGAALLFVVAVAGPVTTRMVDQRYTGDDPRSAVLATGRDLAPDDRVGIVGFPLHYAFTGPDLRTRVDYLGMLRDDGAFVDHATCEDLLSAVESHGLTHVAVLPYPGEAWPAAATWLASSDGATLVEGSEAGRVFRIASSAGSLSCP